MLSPRSYTAEDVVELHCHGGGVCAARVLRAVIEAGARPAKAGEFTLRAFLNGRLDLAQASRDPNISAKVIENSTSAGLAHAMPPSHSGARWGPGPWPWLNRLNNLHFRPPHAALLARLNVLDTRAFQHHHHHHRPRL